MNTEHHSTQHKYFRCISYPLGAYVSHSLKATKDFLYLLGYAGQKQHDKLDDSKLNIRPSLTKRCEKIWMQWHVRYQPLTHFIGLLELAIYCQRLFSAEN